MIDPTVRPARSNDVDQLAWLEAEARTALADQRGGQRWLLDHPERGAGWLDIVAAGLAWVAHIEPVAVGYIVVAYEGDLVRIDEVYVSPGARELGFGDELLATAINAAREHGARILDADALPGDRNTKNLYERAGIKARLITVSTPLESARSHSVGSA
ncbi:MAG TPA: GNAT family N-acetyltransferase [Ilumatobacter sp.]|nr:GNAT family N-acetyltransferase [Ilumatobacter sp.]